MVFFKSFETDELLFKKDKIEFTFEKRGIDLLMIEDEVLSV